MKKPSHVTIVGTGIMGCDIAAVFLAAGCAVHCVARSAAHNEERLNHVRRSHRQLNGAQLDETRIAFRTSLAEVPWAQTDLVIETVPENLALKQSVFKEILEYAPIHVPVASNASGLPISLIAGHLPTAERTAGLHYFLPAHIVPVVEVVKGEKTAQATVDQLYGFMRAVGRVPVRVNRDSPGFLANRIQHALMRESFAVIEEGLATPEDVDIAVRFGFGFRYVAAGPLLQKEFAGLDTQLAAGRSIYPALSTSPRPSPILAALVEGGRLGAKTLSGFWEWTPEQLQAAKEDYETTLLQALKLLKLPVSRHDIDEPV